MLLKSLIGILSLAADSNEAQVIEAVGSLRARSLSLSEPSKLEDSGLDRDLAALTGQTDKSEILGTVKTWKRSADKYDAEAAKTKALTDELRVRDVTKQVDGKIAEGKVLPSDREFAIELGVESPGAFEKFMAGKTAPVVNLSRDLDPKPPAATKTETLTAEERQFVKLLGITAEEFLATKNGADGQRGAFIAE